MSSLFADTHNVVAILEKSDAAEGFEQIIDFLSRSYIHYALIVNPHIYISCIKQFWNTASVKSLGDVTRVGKGFSGVETPLFEEPSLPPQQPQSSPQAPPQGAELPPQLQQVLNGRMIDDMDKDEEIELVKDADIVESEGRHAA
nr:hypothetical protein [Tanacetum cinerariifolium]